MSQRQTTVALLGLLVLSTASCSNKDKSATGQGTSSSGAPADPFHKSLLDKLAQDGLKVGTFETTAARPYKAKTCVQGEIANLEVLLCNYEGEPQAQEGEKAALQFVGTATTGVVRRNGVILLGVADRKKTDLRGQQINKVLKSFGTSTKSGPAAK